MLLVKSWKKKYDPDYLYGKGWLFSANKSYKLYEVKFIKFSVQMAKHFEKFEIIKRLNKGSSTFDPENYVGK